MSAQQQQVFQEKHRVDYQPPTFWTRSIELDFLLDEQATLVQATSLICRNGNHDAPLILDGEQLDLLAVEIDGNPFADYEQSESQLVLHHVPDTFSLKIINRLNPAGNTALEGLYLSGAAFCTQCEAEGFRRITYYQDRPDILAKFSTKITADKTKYPYLLSNGNRIAAGELDDGRHWVSWQDPYPKPCYLFALVAGDFDQLSDEFVTRSGRKVALELYVDKGNLSRGAHAIDSLKKAMAWDEQRFGLEYDLDIYMIVAVDFFNMGAMENKGLNVFNSKFVLANPQTATDTDYFDIERVIGHEYFHNWTGNRITCRDWFQLSLKEGLTVFRDQEFSADLGSRAVRRIANVRVIRGPQFAEDAGPMAHPIRPDVVIEMNNFYTLTVYEKGAEVIRMLHTLLGEQQFQAGMKIYIQQHDGDAATCEDFILAMEAASGRDLTQFRLWYSQAGTPELLVRDHYDAQTGLYTLTVKQQTPPTLQQREKLPLHIPLSVALYDRNGNSLSLIAQGKPVSSILEITLAEQTFEFDVPKLAQKPIVALLEDFSAPVKLDYPYSSSELALLMQCAGNDFIRWDAGQMLLNQFVIGEVKNFENSKKFAEPEAIIHALRKVLQDKRLDPALVAEMVAIPSESSMAELFAAVNIEAIHAVREHLLDSLATSLRTDWLDVYHRLKVNESYQNVPAQVKNRALVNQALGYLARVGGEEASHLVRAHYEQADNMTDTLAAMQAANGAQLALLDELLADFESKWHQDGLVMDNWLRIQAQGGIDRVFAQIEKARQHPAFSLKNPNRVRALIGTFSAGNAFAFHQADGRGYRLLSGVIVELNHINPQVAARLITPLIQFKKLDEGRKALIRDELEKLAALPDLSRDLSEKIGRALSQ